MGWEPPTRPRPSPQPRRSPGHPLHSLCRAGPVDGRSIRSGIELNRAGLLLRHFRPQTARRVTDGAALAPLRRGPRDFLRRSKVEESPSRRCHRGRATSSAGRCLWWWWWCRRQPPALRPPNAGLSPQSRATPSSLQHLPTGALPGLKMRPSAALRLRAPLSPPGAQPWGAGACALRRKPR